MDTAVTPDHIRLQQDLQVIREIYGIPDVQAREEGLEGKLNGEIGGHRGGAWLRLGVQGGLGIGTDGTDRRRAAGGTGLSASVPTPEPATPPAARSPETALTREKRLKAFPSSGGPEAGSQQGAAEDVRESFNHRWHRDCARC